MKEDTVMTLEEAHAYHIILWDEIVSFLSARSGINYLRAGEIKQICMKKNKVLRSIEKIHANCFGCHYALQMCQLKDIPMCYICPIKWSAQTCTSYGAEYDNFYRLLDIGNRDKEVVEMAKIIRDLPWKTEEELK